MKTYRCIKNYPQGPEIGSKAYEHKEGVTYQLSDCSIVRSEAIEDYPGFWELINKKK